MKSGGQGAVSSVRRGKAHRAGPIGFRSISWAIWLVFGLCLLPEVFFSGAEAGLWGDPRARMVGIDYLAFWSGLLGDWRPNYVAQPYLMFLTYGFLHAGLEHFAVNMIMLFSLGAPIAAIVGGWRFLAIYALMLIAGAGVFAVFPETGAPMVGASGALYGLAAIVLAWNIESRRTEGQSTKPMLRIVIMLVGLNAVLWWAMNGQLAWQAHLGGFIAGWALTFVFPSLRSSGSSC